MADVHRIALRFAYDGTLFECYARDPAKRSVEGELLDALRKEGFVEASFCTGSRTDRGVTALENVVRIDVRRTHMKGFVPQVMKHVPPGLWITGVAHCPSDFNPRHHALRTYQYVLPKRGEDLARMQEACSLFVGAHDMRGFAKLEEGRDPVRRMQEVRVEDGPAWMFSVTSPGFLWNQVRRMVSAIAAVGRGDAECSDIRETLASGLPHVAFRLAPAEGLVLTRVDYGDRLQWSDEAGHLGADRVTRGVQSARSRVALMDHLQQIAPWPEERVRYRLP